MDKLVIFLPTWYFENIMCFLGLRLDRQHSGVAADEITEHCRPQQRLILLGTAADIAGLAESALGSGCAVWVGRPFSCVGYAGATEANVSS